jgi:hypothetical protein
MTANKQTDSSRTIPLSEQSLRKLELLRKIQAEQREETSRYLKNYQRRYLPHSEPTGTSRPNLHNQINEARQRDRCIELAMLEDRRRAKAMKRRFLVAKFKPFRRYGKSRKVAKAFGIAVHPAQGHGYSTPFVRITPPEFVYYRRGEVAEWLEKHKHARQRNIETKRARAPPSADESSADLHQFDFVWCRSLSSRARYLSDAYIESLAAPAHDYRMYWDTNVVGFACRVTAAGVKAFVLVYRLKSGRQRSYTIGRCNSWPTENARNRARQLRRVVDCGGDPLENSHLASKTLSGDEKFRIQMAVMESNQFRSAAENWPAFAAGAADIFLNAKQIQQRWSVLAETIMTDSDIELFEKGSLKKATLIDNQPHWLLSQLTNVWSEKYLQEFIKIRADFYPTWSGWTNAGRLNFGGHLYLTVDPTGNSSTWLWLCKIDDDKFHYQTLGPKSALSIKQARARVKKIERKFYAGVPLYEIMPPIHAAIKRAEQSHPLIMKKYCTYCSGEIIGRPSNAIYCGTEKCDRDQRLEKNRKRYVSNRNLIHLAKDLLKKTGLEDEYAAAEELLTTKPIQQEGD